MVCQKLWKNLRIASGYGLYKRVCIALEIEQVLMSVFVGIDYLSISEGLA